MLVSLYVKNLALIDETEVYFGNGLNILTGETGAGKSIIIGSVNLALGAKAEKDMIRTGADYALIELVFQVEKEKQLEEIRRLDLPVEEDGTVILQRRIMPGKSLCKVGGETVSVRQVKALAEILIDIHGQHEHQSLLKAAKQLEILDEYAGEELDELKKRLKECYGQYRETAERIAAEDVDEETRKRESSLAEFEVREIEEAALVDGEDARLEKDYRKLANGQKIQEAVTLAHQLSGYENGGAGDAIGRAVKEIRAVASYDETLRNLEEQLLDIDSLLNDYNRTAADYLSGLEFDGELFIKAEKRLDLINHLKAKYGNTIEEILGYQAKMQEKLDRYRNFDEYKRELAAKEAALKKELLRLCEKASKIRKKRAGELAKSMKKALVDLNFIDVAFEIYVQSEEEKIGPGGYDQVSFMISTNPGEALRPLSQVASGGELSRIMLALKTVLADKDEIETLIFDEIDTGISGKTAWKVSEKMGILGRKHQLICITHLPQIAAMADTHFQIEKTVSKERTTTRIRELEEKESVEELARMLGGASITENVLNNAIEMKDLARKTKQS
ncbi:MAG: DNA repair protein RecN [Blautia sp.]|nr:DNA repair protein RecN [Blautia sp.]MCM1201534.1 DNA repair protein RecN [Bacteroides fragilis]